MGDLKEDIMLALLTLRVAIEVVYKVRDRVVKRCS